MIKLLLVCAMSLVMMLGCEKERQASAEVGAKPKQIIDKVTDDINNANAIANENLKAAEEIHQPEKPAQ